MKNRRIKVFLVDDHTLVREGVRLALSKSGNVEIVGEAAGGREAVRKCRRLRPDVALLDISLPDISGFDVVPLIRKASPATKILALSMHKEKPYVLKIVRAGARGYIIKDAPSEQLLRAIETVHRGDVFFSPEVATFVLGDYVEKAGRGIAPRGQAALSKREHEVLALVAHGLSNRSIAQKLGVALRTAETFRERIMQKLGIHNAVGLARYALAQGLVNLPKAPLQP